MSDIAGPARQRRHDWAAIERAFRSENLPVTDICERFDLPRSTFYYRARLKGWPLPLDYSRPVRDIAAVDEDLARRLRRAAVKRLCDLDRAEAAGELGGERELKLMEGIMKILERLDRLTETQTKRAPAARPLPFEEMQRKREELANKLIQMIEQDRGAPLPE